MSINSHLDPVRFSAGIGSHLINGCFMIEEDASCIDMIALGGHMQRCQTVLSFRGERGASVQQEFHDRFVAGSRRAVKRGQSIARLGLEAGTAVQEQGHHIGFAPFGRHVQRCDVMLPPKIQCLLNGPHQLG